MISDFSYNLKESLTRKQVKNIADWLIMVFTASHKFVLITQIMQDGLLKLSYSKK